MLLTLSVNIRLSIHQVGRTETYYKQYTVEIDTSENLVDVEPVVVDPLGVDERAVVGAWGHAKIAYHALHIDPFEVRFVTEM